MQVREYRPVLLCKHLFFRYVLPEAMICNLLKLLTRTVLYGLPNFPSDRGVVPLVSEKRKAYGRSVNRYVERGYPLMMALVYKYQACH